MVKALNAIVVGYADIQREWCPGWNKKVCLSRQKSLWKRTSFPVVTLLLWVLLDRIPTNMVVDLQWTSPGMEAVIGFMKRYYIACGGDGTAFGCTTTKGQGLRLTKVALDSFIARSGNGDRWLPVASIEVFESILKALCN